MIVTCFLSLFPCALHRHQMDQMTTVANQYGNELHATKQEVANFKQQISHLQRELEKVTMQVSGKSTMGLKLKRNCVFLLLDQGRF